MLLKIADLVPSREDDHLLLILQNVLQNIFAVLIPDILGNRRVKMERGPSHVQQKLAAAHRMAQRKNNRLIAIDGFQEKQRQTGLITVETFI